MAGPPLSLADFDEMPVGRLKGIGPKRLERIRKLIRVGPAPEKGKESSADPEKRPEDAAPPKME